MQNKYDFFTYQEVEYCAAALGQWLDFEFVAQAFWNMEF